MSKIIENFTALQGMVGDLPLFVGVVFGVAIVAIAAMLWDIERHY